MDNLELPKDLADLEALSALTRAVAGTSPAPAKERADFGGRSTVATTATLGANASKGAPVLTPLSSAPQKKEGGSKE